MIDASKAAEIRRLFYAEHWKKGTIAAQLGVHEDVVDRVVGPLGPSAKGRPPVASALDIYKPFVVETLDAYPRLRATRIYDMILGRGYTGSPRTLRRYVAEVRPEPTSEAFVRIERLPGEQSQIDWGHVGHIAVPGGTRALWVFVMVLAFSRAIFAELVLDLSVHSLLRSLVRATDFFGGVTRQWLFDNPKTVVLDRHGDLVRYHPSLLRLSAQMHAQPRLCGVRKPHQKGAVERSIRYLKQRFFAARTIHSMEQGSLQLARFIDEVTMERKHPVQETRTVREVLADERSHLLRAPDPLPTVDLVQPVKADKTAVVHFDRNRYSIPHQHRRDALTLVASDTRVRILVGNTPIAEHERCWGRKQLIEEPDHRRAILESKPGTRDGQGRRRLVAAAPRMEALLQHWLEDGRNMGSMVSRTLKLLDLYGEAVLRRAIDALLEQGSYDIGALAILCDRERHQKKPALPIELGAHVPDTVVPQHDLGGYDD